MGRKACTEPQCLYKGALYFLPLNYNHGFVLNLKEERNSNAQYTFLLVSPRSSAWLKVSDRSRTLTLCGNFLNFSYNSHPSSIKKKQRSNLY